MWWRYRYWLWLTLIVIFAFAVRVGVTITFQGLSSPPDGDANPDQIDYELFAWQMAQGRGYTWSSGEPTASRTPGTSFVLYPMYVMFGRSFVAARLWFCLISAVTCLAAAWLGTLCFGRLVGLLAATWLAVYPGQFYYAMHFLSEAPFGLWLTLACGGAVMAARGQSFGWSAFAGAFWGFAILTRPLIILAVPVAWLLPLLMARPLRWRNLVGVGVQALAITVVVAPWVVRNAVVIGKPTVTTVIGGYAFWGSNNERVLRDPALRGLWLRTSDLVDEQHPLGGTEVEREAAAWRYGMDFVRAHASEMPGLIAWRVYRLVTPLSDTPNRIVRLTFAAGWLLTAPFVLVGLVFAWRRDRVATAILLSPWIGTLISTIMFYGLDRFRDVLAPVFLIFAALALERMLAHAEGRPLDPQRPESLGRPSHL